MRSRFNGGYFGQMPPCSARMQDFARSIYDLVAWEMGGGRDNVRAWPARDALSHRRLGPEPFDEEVDHRADFEGDQAPARIDRVHRERLGLEIAQQGYDLPGL